MINESDPGLSTSVSALRWVLGSDWDFLDTRDGCSRWISRFAACLDQPDARSQRYLQEGTALHFLLGQINTFHRETYSDRARASSDLLKCAGPYNGL